MELWQFGLILLFGFGVDLIESTDFYSLTVNDLQGNSVPMSVFKGKVSVYQRNDKLLLEICLGIQRVVLYPGVLIYKTTDLELD